jgi:flagellar basal body-associated protein FliL
MADDEEEESGKKSKKKLIIVAAVVAGLAYQFVLKGDPPVVPESVDGVPVELALVEGEVAPIPELVVNLADTDVIHYLRLGVAAVLEEGISADSVEDELPKINDVVIDIISGKTFAELRGPGATVALKEELSIAARAAFDDSTVVRVIFTTFVMQ